MAVLRARAICEDDFGNRFYCNSVWNDWGRWAALGVILFITILFFFIWACISARRRRRRGLQPFMGTGWAGGPYNPNNPQGGYYQPPPQYTPADNNQWGQNPNYYSQTTKAGGFEMQPPQNAYQPPGEANPTGTATVGTTSAGVPAGGENVYGSSSSHMPPPLPAHPASPRP